MPGPAGDRAALPPKLRPSNAAVEPVAPLVDGGAFPAKATVGEPVPVLADVFVSGHEVAVAALRWRFVASPRARPVWHETPMHPLGNDRFEAVFVPDRLGRWEYTVVGWVDHAETWRRRTVKKVVAGVAVAIDHPPAAKPARTGTTGFTGSRASL